MFCVSCAMWPVPKIMAMVLLWAGAMVCCRESALAMSELYQKGSVIGSLSSALLNRLSQGRWRFPAMFFGLFGTAFVDWSVARVSEFSVVPETGPDIMPKGCDERPSVPYVGVDEAWSFFNPRAIGTLTCGLLGVLFERRLW